ncbi:MAG: GNAT family N-acetyltransferase [Trueperaceae bacterium]|nr:GNAT family N-acetyltransferase [Trueperaceae bacterium]
MRGQSTFISAGATKVTTAAASPKNYRIVEAQVEHGQEIYEIICLANGFNPADNVPGVFGLQEWQQVLEHFAEGQFVAVVQENGRDKVIGLALAMRTNYKPSEKPLSWRDMIGDLGLSSHDPKGRWLYGVEKAVHPDYQGMGVGSALYKAQFRLIQKLALKGMYAGGMLKGYQNFRKKMSIREYAGKVMRGEIFDPTVSVQMRKGFKPRTIIENYSWDHEADHTGMLIVWEAPRRTIGKDKAVQPRASL